MKAISLWEPWASLMAAGAKLNETRGWETDHRGLLLICAAKRGIDDDGTQAINDASDFGYHTDLHYGMAVCVVDLVDCVRVESIMGHVPELEAKLGDYSPGRFAWMTDGCRPVVPFPVRGMQKLFDVDDGLIEYVKE